MEKILCHKKMIMSRGIFKYDLLKNGSIKAEDILGCMVLSKEKFTPQELATQTGVHSKHNKI